MNEAFYTLCRQTVTVYRLEERSVTRQVFPRAFFEHRRSRSLNYSQNQSLSRVGPREAGSFLLVIPGQTQTVFPGDKVLLGEGPELSAGEWAAFIPSRIPGLAVVTWAEPKYWNGRTVHTEAGD